MEFEGYPAGWLDELKSKCDLVSLIGASVSLTRKGALWWGCCPFHHEKTPSFAVDERKGYFRCYGCHESGDVISWVQKTEGLDFVDAVKYLAGVAGMKVPERNAQTSADYAKKERLYEMMRQAAKHYYGNYVNNAEAREYVRKRGLSDKTAIKFGIGYSVGGQALIGALKQQGYALREMQECSLVGQSADGGYYDFLAGRLIVPIFDAYGHVIAFGGRVLQKKDNVAKYKNSRETLLFQKARTLYGLNFVKKYRFTHAVDSLIVVEGYMDTIALVEAGFENVVASMGTALTEQQAAMMRRLVEKVYICYDGDAAGQNSTLRGLDILKRAGLRVMVVSLPDGLDPDEIIRQRGREAYQACLDNALPLYEYKIERAAEQFNLASADGRSGYAKACLRIIAELDAVEQEAYLSLIADKTGVPAEALRRMLSPSKKPPAPAAEPTAVSPPPETVSKERRAYYSACRNVLALMLNRPDYTKDWLPAEYYSDPDHKTVCNYVLDSMTEQAPIVPGNVYRLPMGETERAAILEVTLPDDKDELAKMYADSTAAIVNDWTRRRIAELLKEWNTCQDEAQKTTIKQTIALLQKQLKK